MPELLEPWEPVAKDVALRALLPDLDDNLPSSTPILTCPGLVDERKGIDRLLDSFAEGRVCESARLVLAGAHSDGIRSLLKGKFASLVQAKRIVSLDRFLSDDEFRNLFWLSDLICLPYPNHIGVSSIYLRAASIGKPILTSQSGWFAWAVPHYGIGTMVDIADRRLFSAAIRERLSQGPSTSATSIETSHQIARENSPGMVKSSWMAGILGRSAQPPASRQEVKPYE
jgi:glycosyltransferase involved in cell wall biosynthesis